MQVNGATALVTGANSGLGRQLAEQLVERGAAKVYGPASKPETVDIPGVTRSAWTSPIRHLSRRGSRGGR
jgi:NAD(P)-dependent dehydrogenase (short-subunit alcohol dehydrogenase family)